MRASLRLVQLCLALLYQTLQVWCTCCTQVSLVDEEMVPILPSKAQRPIAVAYDEVNERVYWTDVRQRTISNYALFDHSQRHSVNIVYLDRDRIYHS